MILDIYNDKDFDIFKLVAETVYRNKGIIGFYSGAWDGGHRYHVIHLQMAKRLCDFLVIGVGTDRLVRHDKGAGRPIYPEQDRLAIIDAIRYVDACFLMDHENDFGVVSTQIIVPNEGVIFKPQGWLDKLNTIPGYDPDADVGERYKKDISESIHGNVIIIPEVECINSTSGYVEKVRGKNNEGI